MPQCQRWRCAVTAQHLQVGVVQRCWLIALDWQHWKDGADTMQLITTHTTQNPPGMIVSARVTL
jgi:hypothetical protein